ncbi:hypothetical protein P43SY_009126 [Pythium insidiosum]|uniref:Uncharacterized protein n=1 Tax=Pythium insidiosum TaxID=114742 RepID=A0AAD5Q7Y9_PYTIN|nr:hypothetical protein P43SY_009126 [Pythium insidiosum]
MVEQLPGTPPLETLPRRQSIAAPGASELRHGLQKAFLVQLGQISAAERQQCEAAAAVIQRIARGYIARRARARLASAVGRPAEIMVTQVSNLEMLCDYRDIMSVYCNVRVLKKPFGPFMFQFTTAECGHVNLPTFKDSFFVPMMSSKCEIVITLIGISASGKRRFLGQALAPLETGWETQERDMQVKLAKWTFPVDEPLVGAHRFVTGTVHCTVKPMVSRYTCMSGQLQMLPVADNGARSRSFFGWTKRIVATTSTPQSLPTPTTPSASRKEMLTRWGVLTDTHLHLFADRSAQLLLSLELSKLQLVQSSAVPAGEPTKLASGRRGSYNEPNRLYPLKLYLSGKLYVFFVSSYAQQQAWEFKIHHRRQQLLVP